MGNSQSTSSISRDGHLSSIEEKPHTFGPFLRFPPEIRNQIYKLLLVTPDSIWPFKVFKFHKDQIYTREPLIGTNVTKFGLTERTSGQYPCCLYKVENHLALFSVSKQVYKESASVFYGQNNFCLRSAPELLNYIHHIGPFRSSCLRSITFDVYGGASSFLAFLAIFEILSLVKGTRTIEVHLRRSKAITLEKSAFEDVFRKCGLQEIIAAFSGLRLGLMLDAVWARDSVKDIYITAMTLHQLVQWTKQPYPTEASLFREALINIVLGSRKKLWTSKKDNIYSLTGWSMSGWFDPLSECT